MHKVEFEIIMYCLASNICRFLCAAQRLPHRTAVTAARSANRSSCFLTRPLERIENVSPGSLQQSKSRNRFQVSLLVR